MLYSTDVTIDDILNFCSLSLKNNTDFNTLVNTITGNSMNYVEDGVLNDIDDLPNLPYVSIHAGNEQQDLRIQEWGHIYEIALVFGVADDTGSVVEDGIKKYQPSKKIRQIVKKAVDVLRGTLSREGINGDFEISLISFEGTTTPTGEADDMNYILTLSFGYIDNITKGC
jgi:hypothetical protein